MTHMPETYYPVCRNAHLPATHLLHSPFKMLTISNEGCWLSCYIVGDPNDRLDLISQSYKFLWSLKGYELGFLYNFDLL